jgi:hypothetical protein
MGNAGGGMPSSILQNPQIMQSIMGQGPGQQNVPNPNGAMPGAGPMMRRPMPMGPPSSGPAQKQPGMMNKFANMATSMAPMFSNMLMEDERKKEALRYR